jgi:glycosyltransferase involved in cell wall biosynthesis
VAVVSIIIPNRNRAKLVVEALESLRAQTFPDWEAHVVDDDSTDGSFEAVTSLSRVDARIHSHRRRGQRGGNTCRNEGFGYSSGEWVIFLDSDDLLSPGCLEGRLRCVEGRTEIDFGVFPHDHFESTPGDLDDAFEIPQSDDYVASLLAFDVPWQTAGPLWKRSSLSRLEPWDPDLKSGQDIDFHVRALVNGMRFQIFDAPRFYVRQASHESVSRRPMDRDYLEHREKLMARAWDLLNQKNQWTPLRRVLVARLHWVVSESWRILGDERRAVDLWTTALSRQVISRVTYFQGRLFLVGFEIPVVGSALRAFRRVIWPPEMRHALPLERIRRRV